VVGERRNTQVMVQAVVPAPVTREQGAGRVRRSAGLAQGRAPGQTWDAVPAGRHEREHDVLAGREARSLAACLDHLARCLVAQHHRHHARARAVDDREVRVAKARGAHANEQLTRARRVEVELLDRERSRRRVRLLEPHLAQDRATHLHA
jgi:hypothetical protein